MGGSQGWGGRVRDLAKPAGPLGLVSCTLTISGSGASKALGPPAARDAALALDPSTATG